MSEVIIRQSLEWYVCCRIDKIKTMSVYEDHALGLGTLVSISSLLTSRVSVRLSDARHYVERHLRHMVVIALALQGSMVLPLVHLDAEQDVHPMLPRAVSLNTVLGKCLPGSVVVILTNVRLTFWNLQNAPCTGRHIHSALVKRGESVAIGDLTRWDMWTNSGGYQASAASSPRASARVPLLG